MSDKLNGVLKTGGAVMAVGGSAAIIAGLVGGSKSGKAKMKKMAHKSMKAMDGILDSVQDWLK